MIQEFFHWWLGQLSSLAPAGWCDVGAQAQDCIVLSEDGAAYAAIVRRRGATQMLGRFDSDQRGADMLRVAVGRLGTRPLPVVLSPPAAQALRKTLLLPRAAQRNLRQALEFEMERETPFRADEIVWQYRIRRQDSPHDRIEVELLLVPRYAIARTCDFVQAAGLRTVAVETVAGDGRSLRISLQEQDSGEGRDKRRVNLALAGAAIVLAIVAVAVPFVRVGLALVAARSEVARLQKVGDETVALRQDIDRLSQAQRFIAMERARVRDPLQVLAAATQALPDSTYVTEFSLRGEQATMVGLSPSAANLIPVLSAGAPFRDPTFGAPVVRPEGGKMELFTIKVQLDPTSAE